MTEPTARITDGTRIRRNPNIVFSQIDNETVMMDEDMENYFGMSAVATRIWSELEDEPTLKELVLRLVEAADGSVSPDQCREETVSFLTELQEHGFLELSEPAVDS